MECNLNERRKTERQVVLWKEKVAWNGGRNEKIRLSVTNKKIRPISRE